jgi:NAD(P)-dependent dehydrogenase (short-subunit alcohol dehydrogenase family)
MNRPLSIVTGASRGIGAAIALELSKIGMKIALLDSDKINGLKTYGEIIDSGGEAIFVECDISKVEDHKRIIQEAMHWGGDIRFLINGAGISSPVRDDLLKIQPDAFDSVMGVNLRGTFFLTQAVSIQMINSSSRENRAIVTISSVNTDQATVDRGEYCISKTGLSMMTKLFALRLAAHNIGVFEIRPGIIRTPMTEKVASKYDKRIAEGLVPVSRWGYPADVAKAVKVLVAEDTSFLTGTVINVDGGLSIPTL